MEVIIVTFLYAVATVDVRMANSNDANLAKTRMFILHDYEIVVSFLNSAAITCIGKFYLLFTP